jgi:transposase
MVRLLAEHHEVAQWLAEMLNLGVDSAQQVMAEVGATAATFPSSKHLASWMDACPGSEESAARTTVIAAPRAIDRCGSFSIRPPTPP